MHQIKLLDTWIKLVMFSNVFKAKLKMSKDQHGNELRTNQSASIHPQEVDYLF